MQGQGAPLDQLHFQLLERLHKKGTCKGSLQDRTESTARAAPLQGWYSASRKKSYGPQQSAVRLGVLQEELPFLPAAPFLDKASKCKETAWSISFSRPCRFGPFPEGGNTEEKPQHGGRIKEDLLPLFADAQSYTWWDSCNRQINSTLRSFQHCIYQMLSCSA
ncbi:hypothetical protein NDU88_009390 [Pleurodeles waltl]|uniref:Uncharacterized protein n=1 Tax=Pleurodeles waltl TaxID=8319 RepID=A0AAV7QTH6_PLEWA|nr:hypothetical protein NDU88_009390 [Pleurodeles waltl]